MVKLINAKESHMISQTDMNIKPATFKSPRANGFEYALVNTYEADDMITLTVEQISAMFSDIHLPPEVLTVVNPTIAAKVHAYRMKNDAAYKAEVEKEIPVKKAPKAKVETKVEEVKENKEDK